MPEANFSQLITKNSKDEMKKGKFNTCHNKRLQNITNELDQIHSSDSEDNQIDEEYFASKNWNSLELYK